jgi:hypothetical protein
MCLLRNMFYLIANHVKLIYHLQYLIYYYALSIILIIIISSIIISIDVIFRTFSTFHMVLRVFRSFSHRYFSYSRNVRLLKAARVRFFCRFAFAVTSTSAGDGPPNVFLNSLYFLTFIEDADRLRDLFYFFFFCFNLHVYYILLIITLIFYYNSINYV